MTPKHAHDPDTFAAALAETAPPEPYPPGTEVWVVPDDEGYVIEKGKIIGRSMRGTVWVVSTPSNCWALPSCGIFPTEATALADRRRYAAEAINRCREQIAQAEAFLGRPQA